MIAAVFDIDRTLLPNTSMEKIFMRWLLLRGKVSPARLPGIVLDIARRLPDARRRGYMEYHGYLRGFSQLDLAAEARDCVMKSVFPRLSVAGRDRILWHRQAGHLTVLLSGSIEPLVTELGRVSGVDATLSTRLESSGGILTGRVLDEHLAGDAKARRVLAATETLGFDLDQSYCYADHHTDLAMLRLFGHPVPVNADKRLRAEAAALNWTVESFD